MLNLLMKYPNSKVSITNYVHDPTTLFISIFISFHIFFEEQMFINKSKTMKNPISKRCEDIGHKQYLMALRNTV